MCGASSVDAHEKALVFAQTALLWVHRQHVLVWLHSQHVLVRLYSQYACRNLAAYMLR